MQQMSNVLVTRSKATSPHAQIKMAHCTGGDELSLSVLGSFFQRGPGGESFGEDGVGAFILKMWRFVCVCECVCGYDEPQDY